MLPPEREAADPPEYLRLQRAFTRHLRDPAQVPAPAAHEERRLAIYRHAIYANVERFVSDNYPRVRAIMTAARWHDMVRDYLIRHVSTASAFVDVPREFLAYLAHQRRDAEDPPFLYELAHFDWLETLIGADERRLDLTALARNGDLVHGIPVANPILKIVRYRYPVHAIDSDYQPRVAPARQTCIAAFRDLDLLYGFLDLNAPAARLLELIVEARGRTGREIFAIIAAELGHEDRDALIAAGTTMMGRMHARGVILGTARD